MAPPFPRSWILHSLCHGNVATLPGFVTFELSQAFGNVVISVSDLAFLRYRKQKEKQTTVKPLLLDRDWEQVYITKGGEGKAGGQGSGHELWLLPEWKHSYQSQCWYQ